MKKFKNIRLLGLTFQTFIILVISVVFISPLFVADDLHDPTRSGKIFFFAQWMLLLIPVGLFVIIHNRKQPFDKISLLVLVWGTWILLRGKYGGIWHDEKFFWFAGCLVFFFLAGVTLTGIVRNGQLKLLLIPALVITLVAAAEAVLGLLQLYGEFRIFHGEFKVTGTFFNPAPYAGFLLASIPWAMLLTNLKRQKVTDKIIYWCGFFAVLAIIVILPATRSRAAYLGLATAFLVWLFYRYKPLLYLKCILNTNLKRRLAYTLVPLMFVILLSGLYLFKQDSADGRLLIWKIAWHTIKDKPVTGHGFNTAQATLAPAQASYFAAGNGSEGEKMLAGSVRWAFNEPLQTASETGVVGMVLLLLLTGYALFYKIPKPITRTQNLHMGAARASLAGITVFGCFSYPFYSLPATLLFFYALAVLAAVKASVTKKQNPVAKVILKIPVIAAMLLLAVFYLLQTPGLKKAYRLWDEANSLYRIGAYHEANESFSEAWPVLKHNGLFLQQYAKNQAMQNKYEEALNLLLQAGNYYKDEFSFIALGDVYKALNQTQKAEIQYQMAADMVPHKFYPLYLLAKLYNETGQHEKAVALARQLFEKEVKVPSKAIEEIKEEMKEVINNNTVGSNKTHEEIKKGNNYTKNSSILIKQQFW